MEDEEMGMEENAELVDALVARMKAADDAMHSGDTGPRRALWSTSEPVTVFGAARSATGPVETDALFDWVASRFTSFASAEWEILSADVSGDLAYVVAIEHTTASIGGAPSERYSLRATTILRREHGQWRAFHRHADPVQGSEKTRDRLLAGAAVPARSAKAGPRDARGVHDADGRPPFGSHQSARSS
jgi:ketosteroid isomerase-like protein